MDDKTLKGKLLRKIATDKKDEYVRSSYPKEGAYIKPGFPKKFKKGDFPALDKVGDDIIKNLHDYETGKIDKKTWKSREAPLRAKWKELMDNAGGPK